MNKKQLAILEWLKNNSLEMKFPIDTIGSIYEDLPGYLISAHEQLTRKEEFEVLRAFAEWGLKEDAEWILH